MDNLDEKIKKEKKSKHNLVLNIILVICFLFVFSYYLLSAPSRDKDVIIHVSSKETLSDVSSDLENRDVVRYPLILKSFVSLISSDKKIPSGDYLFVKNENLWNVAWQLGRGIHKVEPIRITFKEGVTNIDMANLLADKLPAFRKDLFLADERTKQGYLFPDTYFFYPLSTTDEILNSITANFKKRILSVDKEIKSSGKSLSDIIIMASILEKEASGKDDSPIISGILWSRIKLGMPLQVDAAPITYKNINLPLSPISNPGLVFIVSSSEPVSTPYLFYLHDKNGQVHYAINFNEHRNNIIRYLK